MGEHTRGPWKVNAEDTSVYTENGQMRVADVRGWGTLQYKRSGEAEYIANARLIAAAPELLEALVRVMAEAKRMHVDDVLGPSFTTARDAIKKARGEG